MQTSNFEKCWVSPSRRIQEAHHLSAEVVPTFFQMLLFLAPKSGTWGPTLLSFWGKSDHQIFTWKQFFSLSFFIWKYCRKLPLPVFVRLTWNNIYKPYMRATWWLPAVLFPHHSSLSHSPTSTPARGYSWGNTHLFLLHIFWTINDPTNFRLWC